jgi:hypothetical protein
MQLLHREKRKTAEENRAEIAASVWVDVKSSRSERFALQIPAINNGGVGLHTSSSTPTSSPIYPVNFLQGSRCLLGSQFFKKNVGHLTDTSLFMPI